MDDFYFYKIGIMPHKSEDLKLTAVRHYLEKSYNYDETSRIFDCSATSLKRWVRRFQLSGSVSRKKQTYVSYKITQRQVQEAIAILKKHPTISMKELSHQLEEKFKDYSITPQWLGYVLRDNNQTRKRTEHKMLHRFKNTFGSPNEVVIGFGDWEQRKQMKFKEPTKGKGMRELFRKAGYEVYLVDEFRTSCRCHKCEGECSTFRECQNPRPWKKNETILRHGLLMCKTCTGLWNRDVNSSLNIHRIVEHHIKSKGRPQYLCRQQCVAKQKHIVLVSAATSVAQNHILHEDAKPQHWNEEMCV